MLGVVNRNLRVAGVTIGVLVLFLAVMYVGLVLVSPSSVTQPFGAARHLLPASRGEGTLKIGLQRRPFSTRSGEKVARRTSVRRDG